MRFNFHGVYTKQVTTDNDLNKFLAQFSCARKANFEGKCSRRRKEANARENFLVVAVLASANDFPYLRTFTEVRTNTFLFPRDYNLGVFVSPCFGPFSRSFVYLIGRLKKKKKKEKMRENKRSTERYDEKMK